MTRRTLALTLVSSALTLLTSVLALGCEDPPVKPKPKPGPFELGANMDTTDGPIEGVADDKIVSFRGVPYAAPPVGDLRLRPPVPNTPWKDPIDATAFGAACPQILESVGPTSEDCLTLNVWAHPKDDKRPILVFIHGGGFIEGASAMPSYDARTIAVDTGAVVVTLNYRLGALGFLASPELEAESSDGSVGNYGVRDAIAALAWIHANAERFGGDPARTFVFGESAGGIAVCAVAAAPSADGLYSALGIESGPCNVVSDTLEATPAGISAEDAGASFLDTLGCTGTAAGALACAREKTVDEILDAQQTVPVGAGKILGLWLIPTRDGFTLPTTPFEALPHLAVPIVVGANGDEMSVFLAATDVPDDKAYADVVNALYPDSGADLLAAYPAKNFTTPKDAFVTLTTDLTFNCVAESTAIAHQASGFPTYLYAFDRTWKGTFEAFGAFHGIELVTLFDTFQTYSYTPTDDDRRVGLLLRNAWGKMGSAGAPAVDGWPSFVEGAPTPFFIFDDAGEHPGTDWRAGRCAKLRALGLVP